MNLLAMVSVLKLVVLLGVFCVFIKISIQRLRRKKSKERTVSDVHLEIRELEAHMENMKYLKDAYTPEKKRVYLRRLEELYNEERQLLGLRRAPTDSAIWN